ncbi:putative oxidoreductase YdhV [Neomoorella glycerini]|uniref:Putative oxidoreductase YdhV n=1 Tax=Neomoorella glycerini TaxID=55779 RepID=A0A6I5ZU19_9FIRM|nr:aldehyde ferredoxin oxidoreductase family protein [Moorella glycerini]QGP93115.1 putative oxidoreductase YdhV [Moorella glycerini]
MKSVKGDTVLRVNLSTGQSRIEKLSPHFVADYLGGRGFTSRLMLEEIGAEVDPLGPENKLFFATGPFTGTSWPSSSRYTVAAKSPLTGILGDANSGGFWAVELKRAGYDALIIEGRSPEPVYLFIDDSQVSLRSARGIWGKDFITATDLIREELGDPEIKVAGIGQAGENLVRFAAVMNDYYRAAGRTGMGAVMGSKNLKAIAVRGSQGVRPADMERFQRAVAVAYQKNMASPWLRSFRDAGTAMLVDLCAPLGIMSTRNFASGVFPHWRKINAEAFRSRYRMTNGACANCVNRCDKRLVVLEGQYRGLFGRAPEYEAISAFGPRCDIDDLDAIVYANHLCNLYGMDVMSAGGVIAFAIDLFQAGLLTPEETGGQVLKWGDPELLVNLVQDIAFRKGLGDLLAEGERRLAQHVGDAARELETDIKGLEMVGGDIRGQLEHALGWAVASRGCDHLRGLANVVLFGDRETVEKVFGREKFPEILDSHSPKYKGYVINWCENFLSAVDALGLCKYVTAYPVFLPEDLCEAYAALTGREVTPEYFMLCGERITNVERLFNLRQGLTAADDIVGLKFTKPMPEGPAKGIAVEIEPMVAEYYRVRHWDAQGVPTRAKLQELGLLDAGLQVAEARGLTLSEGGKEN